MFVEGLYRDNTWTSSQFRGADLVRLVLGVPLLATALILTMRGSQRALLVWLGTLWLTVYDYAFYLFAAAFNELFLVYVALFGCAILALIFALPRIDANGISQSFKAGTPVKWISGYMAFWVVFLGGFWIVQSLSFVFTGEVPQSVVDSGHPTGIVYALDLSLLLPAVALGAIWLWRRQPWGYVLAVMVNVKGAFYALALVGMGVFADRAGVEGAGSLMPLWGFFAAASLIATIALLRNMNTAGNVAEVPTVAVVRERDDQVLASQWEESKSVPPTINP